MPVDDAAAAVGTVIIGAGQAGLAAGYHLARRRQGFVILEGASTIGANWRERWDSLRLFTPAGFTHLPGLSFPASRRDSPGKNAMADYLASYAEHFALPVALRTRVEAVHRDGENFVVVAGLRRWQTRNVVLASGAHVAPSVPGFAGHLDPGTIQLHSREYRRPTQLPEGLLLVVGAGNSGAEISLDLATDRAVDRQVLLAGREVGHIPNLGPWTYPLMQRLGRVGVALSERKLRGAAEPLGRVRPGQLEAAGVQRLPRVVGARDGRPLLADGRTVTVAAVIWCTGLRPDYSWLHLDGLDHADRLRQHGGVVIDQPGLYVVGQPNQRTITSHLVGGVGADAKHVIDQLISRQTPACPSSPPPAEGSPCGTVRPPHSQTCPPLPEGALRVWCAGQDRRPFGRGGQACRSPMRLLDALVGGVRSRLDVTQITCTFERAAEREPVQPLVYRPTQSLREMALPR